MAPRILAIFLSRLTVALILVATCFALVQTARADDGAPLPRVLSDADRSLYTEIFQLQEAGNLKAAQKRIDRLESDVLMGHVLAQKFMHPTAYRSRFKELRAWLAVYGDHPIAIRIYKLAQIGRAHV